MGPAAALLDAAPTASEHRIGEVQRRMRWLEVAAEWHGRLDGEQATAVRKNVRLDVLANGFSRGPAHRPDGCRAAIGVSLAAGAAEAARHAAAGPSRLLKLDAQSPYLPWTEARKSGPPNKVKTEISPVAETCIHPPL